jgi:hypothetical protein
MVQKSKEESQETGIIFMILSAAAVLLPSIVNQPTVYMLLVLTSLSYWALLIKHLQKFVLSPMAFSLGAVAMLKFFYPEIG